MSRKQITFTATFHGATRKGLSVNGNPRWDLDTSEGTFTTQSDAALGYEISNHTGGRDSWIGREVTFTGTPSGKIWNMELAG